MKKLKLKIINQKSTTALSRWTMLNDYNRWKNYGKDYDS